MPAINLLQIVSTEFYVARENENGISYSQIPIAAPVATALREMLTATIDALKFDDAAIPWETFELSQKYSSEERLSAPLADAHFEKVRELWALQNIAVNANAIREPESIAYYFVIFTDETGERLIAVRRAAQFKGILHSRVLSIVDDTLILDQRSLFKLDNDFDYFVTGDEVFILRPAGLEFTAQVGTHIREAVAQTVAAVSVILPFIDFTGLTAYIRGHRNAARLMGALRLRGDLAQISRSKLEKQCKHCRIEFHERDGRILPSEGHELPFLQLLDRRRYSLSLIARREELYASSKPKGDCGLSYPTHRKLGVAPDPSH